MTQQPLPQALPEERVTVLVRTDTVGRTLNLNTTVTQARVPVATNLLTGVVTGVTPSAQARPGQVLYSVSRVAVRAVQGNLPFYRPLVRGDSGADVLQVNRALVAAKMMDGPATDDFTWATAAAVKKWQAEAGAPASGSLALGEVVAVPTLPASLTLDAKLIRPGVVMAGGEQVVLAPAGEPKFDLSLSQAQARLVPSNASVVVSWQDAKWPAVITGTSQADDGGVTNSLAAPDGGPVCGTQCAGLQGSEQVFLASQVQVVKPTTGPVVPTSALTTAADGTVHVTVVGASGTTQRPVTVLATQDGQSVVKGIAAGDRVQVLAPGVSADPSGTPAPEAPGTPASEGSAPEASDPAAAQSPTPGER